MKSKSHGRALSFACLALLALPALGQPPAFLQDTTAGRQFLAQRAQTANATPAPNLSVTGIYRFGDVYHLSLRDDTGVRYDAVWRTGQNGVTVANGYQIASVAGKTVTLGTPGGGARNLVTLSLAEPGTSGGQTLGPAANGAWSNALSALAGGNAGAWPIDEAGLANVRSLLEAAMSGGGARGFATPPAGDQAGATNLRELFEAAVNARGRQRGGGPPPRTDER
jgi:hypothetical protein